MKSKKLWITILIIFIVSGGASYFFREDLGGLPLIGSLFSSQVKAQETEAQLAALAANTTTIRSAASSATVSAAGNIEVVSQRPVVLEVEGIITEIRVAAGDTVAAGDLLVALVTSDLERAVRQAELNLADSQLQLAKLTEDADAGEITSAQASLASAQENLTEVLAGPSEAELAAAQSSLWAAQQRYQDLIADPSEAELVQLRADMETTAIDLQQAQGDYNKIAYSDSIGASSQAATLQQATITYESAKAAFEVATAPASDADIQDAVSSIRSAEEQLDSLRNQPTAAEVAAAEAQVASAAATLDELLAGASQSDLEEAQIAVNLAQLTLDEARENLAKAQLVAPADGTILSVAVETGQQVSAGTSALTLADLTTLKLTVNVAEIDISKIQLGQPAEITIDALSDRTFSGLVTQIAPASDSEQGVVNYPVTIRLNDPDLSGVRPGMTAVADLLDEDAAAGWLVPTSALIENDGETMVQIMQDGQPQPVSVTKLGTQGEWTIVQSSNLQAGDEAVGGVSSFTSENTAGGNFPGGGGLGPEMGGGPPPGGVN